MGGFLLGDWSAKIVMTTALSFQNLTLGYDMQPAVSSLETTVAEGSLTAIFGPNGAGKSTLLKGVTGSLPPQAGSVTFDAISNERISDNS